jgi:hypothetical protein
MKDGVWAVGQVKQEEHHLIFLIETNVLIDLPLWGRRFTWFRRDERSMSRLDRFLLSESWCLT